MVLVCKKLTPLVIERLAPYLTPVQAQQALAAARDGRPGFFRSKALADLGVAFFGPARDAILRLAVESLRGLDNISYRIELLTRLAPLLSKSLLAEVLNVAHAIDDDLARINELPKLFPYLSHPEQARAWHLGL